MKKLIVLLLAFAMVGAVSAQVTTKVSLSGSVYLETDSAGSGTAVSKLSPGGSGYDILTFTASEKDGKYGLVVQDRDLFTTANLNVDRWNAWYNYGVVKATLGNLNGGSFVQYFNNGWIEAYDPTDGMYGNGLLVESGALAEGLNVGLFYPLTGATFGDTLKGIDFGANYAIGGVATVMGQVNLAPSANVVNVGFDTTAVENLDVYGWGEYAINAGKGGAGLGAQYKTSLYRVGAEVEGYGDSAAFAWDIVANARYYVTPAFFLQVRPEYRSTKDRIRVRGYANYAFGNGLNAEGMVGYDSIATASSKIIHYVRLTYSLSM